MEEINEPNCADWGKQEHQTSSILVANCYFVSRLLQRTHFPVSTQKAIWPYSKEQRWTLTNRLDQNHVHRRIQQNTISKPPLNVLYNNHISVAHFIKLNPTDCAASSLLVNVVSKPENEGSTLNILEHFSGSFGMQPRQQRCQVWSIITVRQREPNLKPPRRGGSIHS